MIVLYSFVEPEIEPNKTIVPVNSINVWSNFLTYNWMSEVFKSGHKGELNLNTENYGMLEGEKIEQTSIKFRLVWKELVEKYKMEKFKIDERLGDVPTTLLLENESEKSEKSEKTPDPYSKIKPSAMQALFQTYKGDILCAAFVNILTMIFDIWAVTTMLDKIITFFRNDNLPTWIGVFYATVLFIVTNVVLLLWEWFWMRMTKLRLIMKASLLDSIYRKSEKLHNGARSEFTSGKIMTIVTTDVPRISSLVYSVIRLLRILFKFPTCFYFLHKQIGFWFLPGLIAWPIVTPLASYLQKKVKKLAIENVERKTDRIKKTKQFLDIIRILKLYCWDDEFQRDIEEIREVEVKATWKLKIQNGIANVITNFLPISMILFSFFSYVWSGTEENPHVLDSNKIFISLNIFWKLEGPLQGLSGTILEYIQARVNDKRIVEMLLQPETSGDNCEHDENIDKCTVG